MVSIVAVPILLALATSWLYLLTFLGPSSPASHNNTSLKFPGSYEELKELAELLSAYNRNHAVYVLVLFSSAYLYKQTFAIPGSVFLVHENKHRLLYWLLFLRLFPMTPNWFLNIASPIIGVPLHLFSISVFIGLMPYNFICVQTGSILSEVRSLNDILTWNTVAKLIVAAAVALLPSVLVKRKAKSI